MTVIYLYICEQDPKLKQENISNTAKILTRILAQKHFDVPLQKTVISKSENGKPFFENMPELHFNISHSNCAIAVAFANSPIGIDIEKLRSVNLKISEKYFNQSEKNYINESPERFLEIWTKKEAFLKQRGLKLKDLKFAQSENIITFKQGDYIISFDSEDKQYRIVTLNNKDLALLLEKKENL